MAEKTAIAWTDSTWTPIRARVKADAVEIARAKGYRSLIPILERTVGRAGPHCEHASPGCLNCYSEMNNGRCLPSNGTGLPFDRRARDLVDMFVDQRILEQPLKWKTGRKIFVCSQTDLFGEFVPDDLIDRVFAVMALSRRHTYQILTKRPARMLGYLRELNWDRLIATCNLSALGTEHGPGAYSLSSIAGQSMKARFVAGEKSAYSALPKPPLPNVWLGVSVEDQERADERIPLLLQTPAAVRFLSVEPLLGPVDLTAYTEIGPLSYLKRHTINDSEPPTNRIDWVITGGESGPKARPFDVEWARAILRQCKAAGVQAFFKQMGSDPVESYMERPDQTIPSIRELSFKDRSGADPAEWPSDLNVQQFPE